MLLTASSDPLDDLDSDELRRRLEQLRTMLDQAPVPIAIAHDPDCRFISGNRAAAALLQIATDANLSLTPPPGSIPPYRIQRDGLDIPVDELPMQYAMAHRTHVRNEIEILRGDGTRVYVQNDVEPIYDAQGAPLGCISVFVDVTDRHLSALTLVDAGRRKDEFLATLSHELRNPLAPLRTALEVMRLAKGDDAMVERARATMERQLLHLVRITDDLLDIARITRNTVELRPERIDLRSVIQSAIESTRPLIDTRHHSLIVDLPESPVWAHADFTRLSQVFANLLNNAAKYTSPGGLLRVRLSAANDWGTVEVSDNGQGIDPPRLPHVFEMFTQLQPQRDRAFGGLGIGLSLARRLLELHGGSIAAHSDGIDRGTTFTARVPLTAEKGGPAESARARDAEIDPCRVLVVDDSPDTVEMMRTLLEFKGHDIRVASDGVEAVALAETFRPAVAFLDIGMPRMDGYEAARRIRRSLGPGVLLVALTGWGQDEDKRLSRDAGFDVHLTKPPDPEVIEELIAESHRRSH
jgi:signal transduction histidine kinase/ActR/RegA family two-component response regulator